MELTLHNPPKLPGVYVLKNIKNGMIYIGSSVSLYRRYFEWRTSLNGSGVNIRSLQLMRYLEQPEDWRFHVVLEMPGADLKTVHAAEEQAIAKVRNAAPDRLLNSLVTGLALESQQPKSIVRDADGKPMSHRAVASAAGVTPKTVQKRLAEMRDQGKFEMTLEEYLTPRRVGRPPVLPHNP